MNPYLKITFRAFTIWILTSFINGLLCGTCISLINYDPEGLAAETLIVFFVSLFFSPPGFFIFWIILPVKLVNRIYGRIPNCRWLVGTPVRANRRGRCPHWPQLQNGSDNLECTLIYERALFRAALSRGFLPATATAIICPELLKSEFSTNKYVFLLFAILSSMAGIIMHFNHFKKINR